MEFNNRAKKIILLQSFILISFFINSCTGPAKDFYEKSDVFGKLSAPQITPDDGTTFNSSLAVDIATSTAGAVICYSDDTSTPSCNISKDGCDAGIKFTSSVNITTTTTIKAITCKNEMVESDIATAVFTYDPNPPILTGSSPDNNEIEIDPTTGTITLVFNENMDTSETNPVFSALICGGNSDAGHGACITGVYWTNASTTGTTFEWLDEKRLQINISWVYFPENIQIRYTLNKDDLKDAAGNAITSDITRTFTTTGRINSYAIADTGQTSCYYCANYDGSDEDCGDDVGEVWTEDDNCDSQTYSVGSFDRPLGQDAHYANKPNGRSFTGPIQHEIYSDDYTTTDNVTGLVWKTCNEGLSGSNCTTGTVSSMDWYDALNQCAALNTANSNAGYAGRKNWRLPTANEIEFLPNFSTNAPAMDEVYFPNPSTSNAWTSTTPTTPEDRARYSWYFQHNTGRIWDNYKYNIYYVRCVSGGASEQSYTVNGDEVIDNKTDLIWEKCSMSLNKDETCSGTATPATSWQAALEYCENLNLEGSDAWRLPSINELKSLLNRSAPRPYIDDAVFPNTENGDYWTATTSDMGFSSAWDVSFYSGYQAVVDKSNGGKFVRCVRDP